METVEIKGHITIGGLAEAFGAMEEKGVPVDEMHIHRDDWKLIQEHCDEQSLWGAKIVFDEELSGQVRLLSSAPLDPPPPSTVLLVKFQSA